LNFGGNLLLFKNSADGDTQPLGFC